MVGRDESKSGIGARGSGPVNRKLAENVDLVTKRETANGVEVTYYAVKFTMSGTLYITLWTRHRLDATGWQRTLKKFGWSAAARPAPYTEGDDRINRRRVL